MGDDWNRERMPLDFLAVGRTYGFSTAQLERLWRRWADDPRYHLAPDPERWLRTAFIREAARVKADSESQDRAPKRGASRPSEVGKRNLVDEWLKAASIPKASDTPRPAPLPFRAELEQIFGTSFGDVRAYVDQEPLLSPHGARAAAFPGGIAFAGTPTKALVAHELTHVRQLQTRGATGDRGAAEAQADGVARAVARGTQQLAISYVPTAAVSFSGNDGPNAGTPVPLAPIVLGALNDAQTRGIAFAQAFERGGARSASATGTNPTALQQALVAGATDLAAIQVTVELAGRQSASVSLDDVLRLFAKIYLGPGLEAVGLPTSFGNDLALEPIAYEVAEALEGARNSAAGITDAAQATAAVRSTLANYRPAVEAVIEQVATTFRDPAELVELELKGAIGKLRELREKLAQAGDPAVGRQIGHLARYILLLSLRLGPVGQRLEQAKKRGNHGAPFAQLEAASGDLQAARAPIASESDTLQALGNRSSLINTQSVTALDAQGQRDPEQIAPEEAFAHHTDATMAQAQDRVASTSAAQERELAALKRALVPERIATRAEFLVVYERWFGFFSKTDRDAQWAAFMQVFEAAMQLMPIAGASGLGAMYGTQRTVASSIAFPGVHDGFEREVGRANLQRSTTVGDRADRGGDTGVYYDFDEQAGGHTGGERSSRDRAAQDQTSRRKRSMDEVYRAKDGGGRQKAAVAGELAPAPRPGASVPLTLYPKPQYDRGRDGADQGWNYLMPVMILNAAGALETVYEHKVMREDVARYLIAISQHMSTVKHKHELRDPHDAQQRLGDAAGRSGDVMASRANASTTYGDPNAKTVEQSARARAQFATSRARAQDVPTAMRQLGGDLEAAMDKFFAGAAPGERLKAIVLDICVKEFSLDETIWHHVTPEALWEFAKQAMKIAALFWTLQQMGPVGQVVSAALNKALSAQNNAQLAGIAVQLGGWLEGATQCTSFARARGWAFAFRSVADVAAQSIRDWIALKAGGATAKALGNAWTPSRSEPRTVGEMQRELAAIDAATRREMATQLEANLTSALGQNKPLGPDQQMLWAMLNAVDANAARALRAKYKALPALDARSPLGVDSTLSVHTPMNLATKAAEVRTAVDAQLERGQTIQPWRVEVLPVAEFVRRFKTEKGRAAVTVVENGHAVIYARADVAAHAVVDEAVHLLQLNDPRHPRLGENIRMLSQGTLEHWTKLDVEARKNLFERKLEVEIDAKNRQLAELDLGDPAFNSTSAQLRDLTALQKQVQALSPQDLLATKASGQMPDYLRDPMWLFSKEKTIGGMDLRAPGVDLAALHRTPVTDSPAAKTKGNHVRQIGQPWTETTTVFASNTGRVAIDPTNPHEITVGGRRYVLEESAQLHVRNGDTIGDGTLLATEPAAKFRLVEVKEGNAPYRERLEYHSSKRGGWVQAGEHSTRRGAMVEQAGRDQVTRTLDAELQAGKTSPHAHDPNRLQRYVRVQHQNAQGQGFDDVIIEFRGDPPKANIRIIEIKDYPGRYTQLAEMSAIRENLRQNMAALRRRLGQATDRTDVGARPAEFRALAETEIDAIRDAAKQNGFQVELHVGPTTLVGSEARVGSMLGQLRHELMISGEFGARPNELGKDVLAKDTTRISQDSVDRAANPQLEGKPP